MKSRGLLLPKDVRTVWQTMTGVQEDMTVNICYEKVVINVPEQVIALCPFVVYSKTLVQLHP